MLRPNKLKSAAKKMKKTEQTKKMKNMIQSEKGFTMAEILAVIFIFSLVLTGLFGIMAWNFNTGYNGLDNQTEHENFRIFNANIVEELQFAKDIQVTNETNRDILAYTTLDGTENVFFFEKDGLYKQVGTKKVKIASGEKWEKGRPAVEFQENGFIHFNFYAKDINAILFLSVKPIVFEKEAG